LNEEKNWSIDFSDLRNYIENAKKLGINIRSIIVINPGNPTG